jgi:hypothetical protein
MEGQETLNTANKEGTLPEKRHDIGTEHKGPQLTLSTEVGPQFKNGSSESEGGKRIETEYKLNEVSSTDSPPRIPEGESSSEDHELASSLLVLFWRRYRPIGHTLIWMLLTAYSLAQILANCSWWICGLVLHREKWIIPTLLYVAITLWLVFRYLPGTLISKYIFPLPS